MSESKSWPSYVDDGHYDYGLSQPNPNYTVKHDKAIAITLPDGKKLVGDVYRPDAPGQFPVIMAFAPYPITPFRNIGSPVFIRRI